MAVAREISFSRKEGVMGEDERRQGEHWTVEMREELWQEKIHVEEKLRCIQDEHFYELLQVG